MNPVMESLNTIIAECKALGYPPKKIIISYELYDALKRETNNLGDIKIYHGEIDKYMDIIITPRIEHGFVIKVETE